MLIEIKVHPGSSREEIKILAKNKLEIWTRVRATDNKANIKICEMLARHFKVAKSLITLKRGANSRQKTFEINK